MGSSSRPRRASRKFGEDAVAAADADVDADAGVRRQSSRPRKETARYGEGDSGGNRDEEDSELSDGDGEESEDVVKKGGRRARESRVVRRQKEDDAEMARRIAREEGRSTRSRAGREGSMKVRISLKQDKAYAMPGDTRDNTIILSQEPPAPSEDEKPRRLLRSKASAIVESDGDGEESEYDAKAEADDEEEDDDEIEDAMADVSDDGGEASNDEDFQDVPRQPRASRRATRSSRRSGGGRSGGGGERSRKTPARKTRSSKPTVSEIPRTRKRTRTQFLHDDMAGAPGERARKSRDRRREARERGGRRARPMFKLDDEDAAPASESSSSSDSSDSDVGEAPPVDYGKTPMALEGDIGRRPSRYAKRRGREEGPERRKAGPAPAGIEPIQVDLNLSWDDVGGLDHHVRALKEMVFLPLLYPEVFDKFKMEPPKGVLFYGPPGTGKTLCARALAASCGAVPQEAEAVASAAAAVGKTDLAPAAGASDTGGGGGKTGVVDGTDTVDAGKGAVDGEVNDGEKLVVTTGVEHIGDAVDGAPVDVPEADSASKDADAVSALAGLFSSQCDESAQAAPADEGKVSEAGDQQPAQPAASVLEGVTETPASSNAETGFVGHLPSVPGDASVGPTGAAKPRPRVAFFMRNGADCLSKWVGEAERQLRMTFEAAKKHQPSIIFFDEIDGLAPVRSARQDQIHSSIVSTLLGLMDGLDGRGQVVVIGATNRVDSVDPALRRPGRFDRELIFTLPNGVARRKILDIHTSHWKPEPPQTAVLDAVASKTVGYCGADLRALCSESALRALRRRYPQIYKSSEKLLIDVDQVQVRTRDFVAAMQQIVPASHRSARTHARPIPARLSAVLESPLNLCVKATKLLFPQGITPEFKAVAAGLKGDGSAEAEAGDDDDDVDSCWSSDGEADGLDIDISRAGKQRAVHGRGSMDRPVLRPRLLLCGPDGFGQDQIGPALLHYLEGCPVHAIDLPSLFADGGSRSPEESLVTTVREACRAVPSILYLPHLGVWWEAAHDVLRKTLSIVLRDIPAELPLFILATAGEEENDLPVEVRNLFSNCVEVGYPPKKARAALFEPLCREAQECPKVTDAVVKRRRAKRRAEVLPKAPPPPPKPVTPSERRNLEAEDDRFIRALRMEMRDFVEKLRTDRRFADFRDPIDPTAVPDYYEVIKDPVWISQISVNVDQGVYPTVLAMVKDFDQLVANVIAYNPPQSEEGAALLRRAHMLVDLVHTWVDKLHPELVERCNAIVLARLQKLRLESPDAAAGAAAAATLPATSLPGSNAAAASEAQQVIAVPQGGGDGDVEMRENDGGGKANGPASGPSESCKANGVNDSKQGGTDAENEVEEEEVIEEEEFLPAKENDVWKLKKVWLSVTENKNIDDIDTILNQCSSALYDCRRSRDRCSAVKELLSLLIGRKGEDDGL